MSQKLNCLQAKFGDHLSRSCCNEGSFFESLFGSYAAGTFEGITEGKKVKRVCYRSYLGIGNLLELTYLEHRCPRAGNRRRIHNRLTVNNRILKPKLLTK